MVYGKMNPKRKAMWLSAYGKMNPKRKAMWLSALRDPKNKQARNDLAKIRSDGKLGMCCLGVACAMHNAAVHPKKNLWASDGEGHFKYQERYGIPGFEVLNWLGIDRDTAEELADKNDKGASFTQIANWIEKNL